MQGGTGAKKKKKKTNANENHSHLGLNANENHSHLEDKKIWGYAVKSNIESSKILLIVNIILSITSKPQIKN
jgi:hypothetical protein